MISSLLVLLVLVFVDVADAGVFWKAANCDSPLVYCTKKRLFTFCVDFKDFTARWKFHFECVAKASCYYGEIPCKTSKSSVKEFSGKGGSLTSLASGWVELETAGSKLRATSLILVNPGIQENPEKTPRVSTTESSTDGSSFLSELAIPETIQGHIPSTFPVGHGRIVASSKLLIDYGRIVANSKLLSKLTNPEIVEDHLPSIIPAAFGGTAANSGRSNPGNPSESLGEGKTWTLYEVHESTTESFPIGPPGMSTTESSTNDSSFLSKLAIPETTQDHLPSTFPVGHGIIAADSKLLSKLTNPENVEGHLPSTSPVGHGRIAADSKFLTAFGGTVANSGRSNPGKPSERTSSRGFASIDEGKTWTLNEVHESTTSFPIELRKSIAKSDGSKSSEMTSSRGFVNREEGKTWTLDKVHESTTESTAEDIPSFPIWLRKTIAKFDGSNPSERTSSRGFAIIEEGKTWTMNEVDGPITESTTEKTVSLPQFLSKLTIPGLAQDPLASTIPAAIGRAMVNAGYPGLTNFETRTKDVPTTVPTTIVVDNSRNHPGSTIPAAFGTNSDLESPIERTSSNFEGGKTWAMNELDLATTEPRKKDTFSLPLVLSTLIIPGHVQDPLPANFGGINARVNPSERISSRSFASVEEGTTWTMDEVDVPTTESTTEDTSWRPSFLIVQDRLPVPISNSDEANSKEEGTTWTDPTMYSTSSMLDSDGTIDGGSGDDEANPEFSLVFANTERAVEVEDTTTEASVSSPEFVQNLFPVALRRTIANSSNAAKLHGSPWMVVDEFDEPTTEPIFDLAGSSVQDNPENTQWEFSSVFVSSISCSEEAATIEVEASLTIDDPASTPTYSTIPILDFGSENPGTPTPSSSEEVNSTTLIETEGPTTYSTTPNFDLTARPPISSGQETAQARTTASGSTASTNPGNSSFVSVASTTSSFEDAKKSAAPILAHDERRALSSSLPARFAGTTPGFRKANRKDASLVLASTTSSSGLVEVEVSTATDPITTTTSNSCDSPGSYPGPSCSEYYECIVVWWWYEPRLKSCSDGFGFSAVNGTCVPTADSDCLK